MTDDIKTLRESYNLSRKEFCEYFGIPYRTLQSWELGDRECPDYVIELIKYRLQNEKEQS